MTTRQSTKLAWLTSSFVPTSESFVASDASANSNASSSSKTVIFVTFALPVRFTAERSDNANVKDKKTKILPQNTLLCVLDNRRKRALHIRSKHNDAFVAFQSAATHVKGEYLVLKEAATKAGRRTVVSLSLRDSSSSHNFSHELIVCPSIKSSSTRYGVLLTRKFLVTPAMHRSSSAGTPTLLARSSTLCVNSCGRGALTTFSAASSVSRCSRSNRKSASSRAKNAVIDFYREERVGNEVRTTKQATKARTSAALASSTAMLTWDVAFAAPSPFLTQRTRQRHHIIDSEDESSEDESKESPRLEAGTVYDHDSFESQDDEDRPAARHEKTAKAQNAQAAAICRGDMKSRARNPADLPEDVVRETRVQLASTKKGLMDQLEAIFAQQQKNLAEFHDRQKTVNRHVKGLKDM
ncbi:hypothetical protein PsorP6_000547 [Peronosclerospora sorghi]|uniref:Uncharacterized protein n=1 Tax=Peronosclerospora sorghi TaxID=230839 RepID=A0ACC0WSU5_9STRA|nr:hypothetical protein PsorP6_000547 [Peronosclerospora sorghi]